MYDTYLLTERRSLVVCTIRVGQMSYGLNKTLQCAQWKLKVDEITNLPKRESKLKSSKKWTQARTREYYKSGCWRCYCAAVLSIIDRALYNTGTRFYERIKWTNEWTDNPGSEAQWNRTSDTLPRTCPAPHAHSQARTKVNSNQSNNCTRHVCLPAH